MNTKAQNLFTRALELPESERDAFLSQACGDDAELHLQVQRMLVDAARADSFFGDENGATLVADPDLEATIEACPSPRKSRPAAQVPLGSSSANPSPEVPFIFGRRIARGGMGEILEASDCKLGRTIAAKVMLLEQDASDDMRQRFIQEAAVLAKLAHPNIVPVYDLGHDSEGQLYYTMKLVKGRTLQDIIDSLRHEKPDDMREFTLDRLLTIFRKVADALAFAHSKGIIHRDLKPENIMVGEFGEVLLMDWGLAKIQDQETGKHGVKETSDPPLPVSPSFASLTHTLQGAVMGTPRYMSPEQAMGLIDELDSRSDIFSLGGILYAILTLRPPVEGKTMEEVLDKVRSGSITAPTAFGTTASGAKQIQDGVLEAKAIKPLPHIPAGRVPAALSAVAMKALTLDKTKRYQDVAAFSADIEAYQNGFATTAEQAGLGKQLVLLIKRHKGIFSTAAAAWLLITALAVWFVINLRAKEQRATQAEAVAVQEKETARQALAKSQLDLAEKEFERGKFVEAQKILEETPESFRDANWRFLRAHSRDFTAQLSIPGKGSVRRLQFLPKGDHPTKARLQFNQTGDWLACLGGDEVILWNVKSGLKERALHFPGETVALLSPRGDAVATFNGYRIRLWDTTTGRLLRSLNGASTNVVVPAFSSDGKMLLSSHDSATDGIVTCWPIRLGEEIASVRAGTTRARRVLFDRDGSKFYGCASSGGRRLGYADQSPAVEFFQDRRHL